MNNIRWVKVDKTAPSARADFVRQWIMDLFNPEAKQIQGYLMKENGGMCCLGVASNRAKIKKHLINHKKSGKLFTFSDNGKKHTYQELPESLVEFLNMGKLGDFRKGPEDNYNKDDFNRALGVNRPCSLADANDKQWGFLRIGKLIRDFPRAVMRNLTDLEIEYIKATPVPKRDEYRAKRCLLADSRVKDQAPQIEDKEVPPRLSKS